MIISMTMMNQDIWLIGYIQYSPASNIKLKNISILIIFKCNNSMPNFTEEPKEMAEEQHEGW